MSGDATQILERERLRAFAQGGTDWGVAGDSRTDRRFAIPASKDMARICFCGCRTPIVLVGMANGMPLMSGCEFSVRRWVKNR